MAFNGLPTNLGNQIADWEPSCYDLGIEGIV